MTKNEVKILTGEFGLFAYDDIRQGFEDARVNDVQIKMYHVRVPSVVVEELQMLGCKLHNGNFIFPDEHYVAFDDDKYMISEQADRDKPVDGGVRHGPYWENNPRGVSKMDDYFYKLFKPSETVTEKAYQPPRVEIKDARVEVWHDFFGNTTPPTPEPGASTRYAGFLDRRLRHWSDVEAVYRELRGKG